MKRWILRIVLGSAALVIVLVAALAWMFYSAGREGSSALEQWIGGQIKTVAGSYLNPKLNFEDLDYQQPFTVKLKNLRLTSDDPANPGQTIDIVGTEDATLTLGEVPRVGRPLKIEKIILNKPLFQAVSIKSGESDFVGFANLMKPGAISTQPSAPSTTQTKLSDAFQIQLIELKDGIVKYDPRIAGTPAMELNKINTKLAISPTSGGTYHIETKIVRDPVFSIALAGDVDLDNFSATGILVDLKANLGEEQATYLPPQLQKMLKDHGVRGALTAKIAGGAPIMEPMKGDLSADVKLIDGHFQSGDYSLPIRDFELAAKLKDGHAVLEKLLVQADHGVPGATANAAPTTAPALDLSVKGDLDLAKMTVDGVVVDVKAAVGRDRDGYLPPDVRKLLAEYQVNGDMVAHLTGSVPIDEPMKGTFAADVKLANGHLAAAGCEIPVESLLLAAKMAGGQVAVENFRIIGGAHANDAEKTPAFDVAVVAKMDLATRVARDVTVQIKTLIGPEYFGHLPPEIAALLRKYEVRGVVGARLTGGAPIDDPMKGKFAADLNLADARVHAGGFVVPIKLMDLSAKLADGRVVLERLHAVSAAPVGDANGRPAFELLASGKLALKDLILEDVALDVKAMVGREHDALLPPDVQQLMQQHDVRGLLAVHVTGSAPIATPLSGTFVAEVRLDDWNYRDGEFHVPIKLMELSAKGANGKVTLSKMRLLGAAPAGDTAAMAPFDVSLSGMLDINTWVASDVNLAARASFGPGYDNYFPPEIQTLLKQYQIRGGVGIGVKANIPLQKPLEGTASASVRMGNVFLAAEGAQLPLTKLDIDAQMVGGRISLTKLIAIGPNTAQHAPAFDLSAVGNLTLSNMTVDNVVIDLKTLLGREQDVFVPTQAQKYLKEYDVSGLVNAHITGGAPLHDARKGTLAAAVTVDEAHIVKGNYRYPVKKLDVKAKLADQRVLIEGVNIDAVRGSVVLIGNVTLNDALDADLGLTLNEIFLEDVLQRVDGAEDVKGRVSGMVNVTAPLRVVVAKAAPPTTAPTTATAVAAIDPWSQIALPENWGHGSIQLDNGRLAKIPVIDSLVKKLGGADQDKAPRDTADLRFVFAHDDVNFSLIDYRTTVVAAHGKGTVSLNRKLDLSLNGGPLEKMTTLFNDTIAAGITKVTDSISTYRVTGTTDNPVVSVDLAGTPVAEVKEKVSTGLDKGLDATGKGIKKAGETVGDIFKKLGRKDQK